MRVRFVALGMAVAAACSEQQVASNSPTDPGLIQGGLVVTSMVVAPSETTIEVGRTTQLTAVVSPMKAMAVVTWSSSDKSVATVSGTGLVTAVAAGRATISAVARRVTATATVTVTSPPTTRPPIPPSTDPVLVGAGDIASCLSSGDEATADLLDGIAGTVATLGDNAYDNGTTFEYTSCYGPTWGRYKARTKPSPGNHEYNTPNATGYYEYFGAAAGDPTRGYYSYDLGAWHIIVLNTTLGCSPISCAAGSAQEQWLRADLAAHSNVCTLAYWHHPRFNSGRSHGDNPTLSAFWDALYAMGADVVLNGHEHVYERFAPQTPAAAADSASGIRQFTVGTGGRSHGAFATTKANSEVREGNTYGVLKLTLHATSYDWRFVPMAGATFTDTGTGSCH